jgi:hypothetical protein
MNNRVAIGTIISITISLIALFFGNNIYSQIRGQSIFDDIRGIPTNTSEPFLSATSTTTITQTVVTVTTPTSSSAEQVPTQSYPITNPSCAGFISTSEMEELKLAQDVSIAIAQSEEFSNYQQTTYRTGDTVPAKVLIKTDLLTTNVEQYGVVPIRSNGGWGLFLTTYEFIAPTAGAYICISENILVEPTLSSTTVSFVQNQCLPTQYTFIGDGWVSPPTFLATDTGATRIFSHCPPMATIQYNAIAVDDHVEKVELVCISSTTEITDLFTPYKKEDQDLLFWRSSRITLESQCRIDFTISDYAGVNIGLQINGSEP